MDTELNLEDFTDFTFENYAFETEVKSEESEYQVPNSNDNLKLQEVDAPVISLDVPSTSTNVEISSTSTNKETLDVPQATSDDVETCLSINQAYQRHIVEQLTRLQITLSKNRQEQAKIDDETYLNEKLKVKSSNPCPKYLRPITLFASPYFRDARGMVPPDNEDAKMKRMNEDVDAYLTQAKPFGKEEYDKLLSAVKENVKTLMMEPHKTKRDYLKSKVKSKQLSKEEDDFILNEIVKHEDTIETIGHLDSDDFIEEYENKIDWLMISAAYMEGFRSAEECEYIWRNYLKPTVNKNKFSPEEDAKLSRIAERFDFHDWDRIAQELNTNRTAIQCFERYQSRLNQKISKKYWTKEEDDHLKSTVESLKVGNYIPWHKVVLCMDGRTRHQITNRWTRTTAPENKRGSWSASEDALLCAGVKRYGKNWKKVKLLVPGRSNYLCRERYLNILAEGYKVGEWTPWEDRLLIELARKYNFGKWAKICLQLPNRTDNMCLQRAQRLKAYHPQWFFPKPGTNEYEEIRTMGKDDDRIAPSSVCRRLNKKRKLIRVAAEEKLLTAMRKVSKRDDIESVNDMDFTEVSLKFMNNLRKVLLKDDDSSKNDDWKPRYNYFVEKKFSPNRKRRRKDSESNDDSPSDELEQELELELKSDAKEVESAAVSDDDIQGDENSEEEQEEKYYDSVLDSLLKPRVVLNPTKTLYRGVAALSRRERAEYSIFKNYMFKMFDCSQKLTHEVNNDPESFGDYEETVPRILQCFILPPARPNYLPVMPANHASLTGMEVLKNIRFSAIKSAAHVERSQALFQILSTDVPNIDDIKCLYCLHKMGNLPYTVQTEGQTAYMIEMRKGFEVVDDTLRDAIKYESVRDKLPTVCNCDAVVSMRQRIALLRKRFASLFLWSWLLTNSMPTEKQKASALKRKYTKTGNK